MSNAQRPLKLTIDARNRATGLAEATSLDLSSLSVSAITASVLSSMDGVISIPITLKINTISATTYQNVPAVGGLTNFSSLTDAFTYAGNANKLVVVNPEATGLTTVTSSTFAGVTNFSALTDTFDYNGIGGRLVTTRSDNGGLSTLASTVFMTAAFIDATFVKLSEDQTIAATHTFANTNNSPPFLVDGDATDRLVAGLNADKLDDLHAAGISSLTNAFTKLSDAYAYAGKGGHLVAVKSTVDGLTSLASSIFQLGPLTGDVTTTFASSTATVLGNNVVSNAKFRQSGPYTLIGVSGGSQANITDISATQTHQVMIRTHQGLNFGPINLQSTQAVSGALPIANGGTGQITNTAAINALLGVTPSSGDMVYFQGSTWEKIPAGEEGQILTFLSGVPTWSG